MPFLGGRAYVPKARIKAITELFTNEILSFPSSSPIVSVLPRTLYPKPNIDHHGLKIQYWKYS